MCTDDTRVTIEPYLSFALFIHRKDVFTVDSDDLGRINRIIVGHDNTWLGAGWFLDKVVICLSQCVINLRRIYPLSFL